MAVCAVEEPTIASDSAVATRPALARLHAATGTVAGEGGLTPRLRENGVRLALNPVRIGHPDLVLQCIAASRPFLDVGLEPGAGEPDHRLSHLFGRLDLDTEVADGARDTGSSARARLDEHELERRLFDRVVGVLRGRTSAGVAPNNFE